MAWLLMSPGHLQPYCRLLDNIVSEGLSLSAFFGQRTSGSLLDNRFLSSWELTSNKLHCHSVGKSCKMQMPVSYTDYLQVVWTYGTQRCYVQVLELTSVWVYCRMWDGNSLEITVLLIPKFTWLTVRLRTGLPPECHHMWWNKSHKPSMRNMSK